MCSARVEPSLRARSHTYSSKKMDFPLASGRAQRERETGKRLPGMGPLKYSGTSFAYFSTYAQTVFGSYLPPGSARDEWSCEILGYSSWWFVSHLRGPRLSVFYAWLMSFVSWIFYCWKKSVQIERWVPFFGCSRR